MPQIDDVLDMIQNILSMQMKMQVFPSKLALFNLH